jgi:SAM-dependent methyltransferase
MSVSCLGYRAAIDPLLRSLRPKISRMIPQGSSVLELGSGTGAQACSLADRCSRYLGVDLNPVMAGCAAKRCRKASLPHITFIHADGRDLGSIGSKEFDYAVITLALHEMDHPVRIAVLRELKRTAKNIIIADYAAPLPRTLFGFGTRMIEKMAGKDHYAGFLHYQSIGGIPALTAETGLTQIREETALGGITLIVSCR